MRLPRRRCQFSLRSLLVVIAALSVPFWLMTLDDPSVRFWGTVLLIPVAGGGLGYLAAGGAGLWPGVGLAVLLALVIAAFVLPFL